MDDICELTEKWFKVALSQGLSVFVNDAPKQFDEILDDFAI